ncbi:response regulator [soil metagenome]
MTLPDPLPPDGALLRLLFRRHPTPMWIFDAESLAFLDANEAAVSRYGYSREEFLAMSIRDIRPPDDVAALDAVVSMGPRGLVDAGVWRHRTRSGEILHVHVTSHAVDLKDRPARLVTAHDVTDQAETDADLRRTRELRRVLLESSPIAIISLDRSGVVTSWNPAAERSLGWKAAEVLGQPLPMVQAEGQEEFAGLRHRVLAGESFTGHETVQVRKDGGSLPVSISAARVRDASGEVTGILAFVEDITDRKREQDLSLRAQRVESIGKLAGGIAHDLNNVLSPILMASSLLREESSEEERVELVDTIEQAARRGADLVKQILGFARGERGTRVALDPETIAAEVRGIVVEVFPKNVEFEMEADPDLQAIRADPTQLHQVLMNLCVNARDAMPTGGRLSIRIRNTVVDSVYAETHPDARVGPYVQFEVADTGVGMTPQVRDRLFDPFFTTKDVGQGTGLGLPTVLGIVKNHGGFLQVYGEVGVGSVFRVNLPSIPLEQAAPGREPEPDEVPTGSELILVVDDEEAIRSVVQRTLERFGYRVITAVNGRDAVRVFAEHADDVELVIMDMAMPVLDGRSAIPLLHGLDPELPIVAASGYASGVGGLRALETGALDFLPKPFTAERLLRTVRRVLDRSGTVPGAPPRPNPIAPFN